MTKDLFYSYPDTSKIRIHHKNVFTNDKGLFLIQTKRLRFTIAEKLCIRNNQHILIPLSIYRQELNNFYKRVCK